MRAQQWVACKGIATLRERRKQELHTIQLIGVIAVAAPQTHAAKPCGTERYTHAIFTDCCCSSVCGMPLPVSGCCLAKPGIIPGVIVIEFARTHIIVAQIR